MLTPECCGPATPRAPGPGPPREKLIDPYSPIGNGMDDRQDELTARMHSSHETRETKYPSRCSPLTSPACPAGPQILRDAVAALERLQGVDRANVRLVLTPPWSPDRMSDEARDELGIF